MLTVVTGMLVVYVTLAVAFVGIGLLLTHIAAVTRWDQHASVLAARHRTPFWNQVSHWGTFIANTLGVIVVAAIVTAAMGIRRQWRRAAIVVGGLIVELAVFLTVNYTVRRPRPAVKHLGSTPSTYSFPSGHAAATLVLYGGIALIVTCLTGNWMLRALSWTAAVVFPLWVAFSRVAEGQHHLTDVAVGLVMGAGVLVVLEPLTVGAPPDAERHDPHDEAVTVHDRGHVVLHARVPS